jgi:hypothetical protein
MVFLTPLDDFMMHTSALMIPSAMFAWKVEFMLEPADQISEFSSWQLSNKNVMLKTSFLFDNLFKMVFLYWHFNMTFIEMEYQC